MARIYAGILGLLAMLVSLVRGLALGGGSDEMLWDAWLSLIVFALIGAVIGWLGERIVRDSVSSRILAEIEGKQNK